MMDRWLKRLLAAGLACMAGSAVAATVMPQPDVLINASGRHLVLNLPQARLFVYQDGQLSKIYPVAVGKLITQTPTGSFDISGIYKAPAWHVPKSIQDEMKRSGKPVQTVVPPGPDNPLGPVFIRFGESKLGLGFHGTNAPASVPGFRSHGCVRLKNEDVEELAATVARGDAVTVTYQTILLNQDAAGDLWLTAYRNHYKQDDPSMPLLAQTLLDWQQHNQRVLHGKRVDEALARRSGQPVCLSCKGAAKAGGELAVVPWLSHSAPAQPELTQPVNAPPTLPAATRRGQQSPRAS